MALDHHYATGVIRPASSGVADLLDLIERARPEWMRDALCREYPGVSFFPERGQTPGPARAICARCAVAFECRQAGIDGDEAGVWGGLDARARKALRAETRKAADPEEPAA
ncbi:MAG: WhiB family transcriptional regulator [Actinomycetota bacterium]